MGTLQHAAKVISPRQIIREADVGNYELQSWLGSGSFVSRPSREREGLVHTVCMRVILQNLRKRTVVVYSKHHHYTHVFENKYTAVLQSRGERKDKQH